MTSTTPKALAFAYVDALTDLSKTGVTKDKYMNDRTGDGQYLIESRSKQASSVLPMPNISTGNPDDNLREWQRLSVEQQADVIRHNAAEDARRNGDFSGFVFDTIKRLKSEGADSRQLDTLNAGEFLREPLNSLFREKYGRNPSKEDLGPINEALRKNGLLVPEFFNGGIVGGRGGRDNNVIRASRGEGIIQASTMKKIGPKGFDQLNKTGELPQQELKSTIESFMKTPPWMKDFQSSVATLAGTSIKAELAPVSVNVKINGAEVLASIQGQMRDLIKREVMTAVGNMYHDNSGKHHVRGMN